jgi:hypothetical protein
MAQGGSGRSGGKSRPAGRGSANGRGSSSARGSGSGAGRGTNAGRGAGARPPKQTAAAAQRAIKGARGRSGRILRVVVPIVVVAVLAAVVVVGVLISNKNATSTASGKVPPGGDSSANVLASTGGEASGDTVDGVQSNDTEQVLFHVHAHLAIYVNGKPKLLPYGVGIVPPYQLQQTSTGPFVDGGSKFYWLHTHDETGVIHIESPVQRSFTLGNFFDVWHQTLSATQVGPAKGTVTAFVGGKKYTGDPKNIPLGAHSEIQLDVGTVVPFANYTFPQGL